MPKAISKTPALPSERIHGSKNNPKGSAESKKSAISIKLSDSIITTLENKKDEYNKKHPNSKVTLGSLKAVMRRGMGAYSTSHRPTISGGAPNSRQAWAFARVNKFLLKKGGTKVKAAYVQDDDLMADGGEISWDEYVKTQFDENENRYLPENYFDDFTIQEGKKQDYPTILKEKYGLEYRKWKYGGIGVFDGDKRIAFADNGSIQVSPLYQKKGIGLELVTLLKELNPSHKFGNMTPQGWNLMRSYYDKKVANKYEHGGLLKSLSIGMDNLKKNGIVLKDNEGNITLIAYNTGNQPRTPSLYNKSLIYSSIEPIKSANEIIQSFDLQHFEKFDIDKINEYEKSHLIVINQNEVVYDSKKPDIRYEDGGKTGEEITCKRCDWEWNTDKSDPKDKYICHKCRLNNEIYYKMYKRGGNLPVGKLAKGMNLSEVAALHGLNASDLKSELKMGIHTEMEHTDKPEYARAIALDHLYEDPKYYTKWKKMEGIDSHYESISEKYANGGEIDQVFSFRTPTGEPSKLTYVQQVLVRTKAFKQFFGDWELAAKKFNENRWDFEKHYKDVSKIIDFVTFEPRIMYHGTRTESEFFRFDVTREKGSGRPYGYFANNKEYSENFLSSSQRGHSSAKPFLYEVFLNVRNPFMANTIDFYDKKYSAKKWMELIVDRLVWDKFKTTEKSDEITMFIVGVKSQIYDYVKSVYQDSFGEPKEGRFWLLMARDIEKDFKFFLMAYGYDGIEYAEEFSSNYDVDNPSEFTKAVTIFDSHEVKLADGRNLNFNPLIDDIRFAYGGEVEEKTLEQTSNSNQMDKKAKLGTLLFGKSYAEGGEVVAESKVSPNDGKKGGYFKGRSHADGGIKAVNKDTGQMIEVEGEEVIITKGAVNDNQKREFEGEMLTNREILSRINESGGGVSFADGGALHGASCGCSGKKYKFGGELIEDYDLMKIMNYPFNTISNHINNSRSFVDDLVSKMK